MLAIDLISPSVPALSPEDNVDKALGLMNVFHTDRLPLVAEKVYLGLMEEETLLEAGNTEVPLSDMPLSVLKPAIRENVHFFEALKVFGDYQLRLLPVVDQAAYYLGVITSENLLKALSRFNGIQQEGGLLVLKMKPSDYMLSEIARIAESVEVTLLGVHTVTIPESETLKVLLKTNYENLNVFIASLQQLNYEVIYRFDKEEDLDELQRNYDNLMNYINM